MQLEICLKPASQRRGLASEGKTASVNARRDIPSETTQDGAGNDRSVLGGQQSFVARCQAETVAPEAVIQRRALACPSRPAAHWDRLVAVGRVTQARGRPFPRQQPLGPLCGRLPDSTSGLIGSVNPGRLPRRSRSEARVRVAATTRSKQQASCNAFEGEVAGAKVKIAPEESHPRQLTRPTRAQTPDQ